MVFGEDKAPPTAASYQEVHDLRSKVEGMAKHLGRVEGSSNRDLHHAVAQGVIRLCVHTQGIRVGVE